MQQHQKQKIPAVEGLFSWPSDDPRLIVSRCKSCKTCYFPPVSTCVNPDCDDKGGVEQVHLSRRGKLWSYTTQHYCPPQPFPYKSKEEYAPFAIGIVEFPEGIRVAGMLTTTGSLEIGTEYEMIVDKLDEDEENEYLTWKFRPTKHGG
jgi:uncharacterized OB-fold protein